MAALGIDYGTKRTGLAIEVAGIAMPLGSVATHLAEAELKKIVPDRKIDLFVIGRPDHADGTVSKETGLARAFANRLKKVFPSVPIVEQDERHSSAAAYFSLAEAGISRKDAGRIDEMAASIILQDYLDSHS